MSNKKSRVIKQHEFYNKEKNKINDMNKIRDNCNFENESNFIDSCEDKTKYGEMIPSMFSWITPSEQKERADELNSMTKKKK